MKTLILHVGLPKCASTFFQNKIFPNILDIEYVHKDHDQNNFLLVKYLRDFLRKGLIEKTDIQKKCKPLIDKLFSKKECILISDENLSLSSMDIWNYSGCSPKLFSDRLNILKNLFDCEISIIYMTRDLGEWFASRYAQSSPNFKNPDQNHFEKIIEDLSYKVNYHPSINWLSKNKVYEAFQTTSIYHLDLVDFSKKPIEKINKILNDIGLSFETDYNKIHLETKLNSRSLNKNFWKMRNNQENIHLNKKVIKSINKIENNL